MVPKKVFFWYLICDRLYVNHFVLIGLKIWMHVLKIRLEGTVSQNFVIYFSLYFMAKNG